MIENQIAKFFHIWISGGWTMIPLLLVSLFIYGSAARLWVYLTRRGYNRVSEKQWRAWVMDPSRGEGEVGEMIRYTQDEALTEDQIQNRFSEILSSKLPAIDRSLQFINVMVGAAPLLGLLGTVLGMLATFHGISLGGSKTIDIISSGISEALITTEMGLLIALPGYLFAFMIKRKREEYEAFLASLESFTLLVHKKRAEGLPLDPPNPPPAVEVSDMPELTPQAV